MQSETAEKKQTEQTEQIQQESTSDDFALGSRQEGVEEYESCESCQ